MSTAIERLEAAKGAVDAAKRAYDEALAAVEALARETGATQFKGASITVSVCTRRSVDSTRLLAWVQENAATEIEPAVRPAYRRRFLDGLTFTPEGDAVTETGEVIDWADLTSYLRVVPRGESR